MSARFESQDGTLLDVTLVRFVRPVFDVVLYDGTNAVAVLEWLHNRSYQRPRLDLDMYLKMTNEGLRLIQGFDHIEVEPDSYIGFGVPPRGVSEDGVRLVVIRRDSLHPALSLVGDGIERWQP